MQEQLPTIRICSGPTPPLRAREPATYRQQLKEVEGWEDGARERDIRCFRKQAQPTDAPSLLRSCSSVMRWLEMNLDAQSRLSTLFRDGKKDENTATEHDLTFS